MYNFEFKARSKKENVTFLKPLPVEEHQEAYQFYSSNTRKHLEKINQLWNQRKRGSQIKSDIHHLPQLSQKFQTMGTPKLGNLQNCNEIALQLKNSIGNNSSRGPDISEKYQSIGQEILTALKQQQFQQQFQQKFQFLPFQQFEQQFEQQYNRNNNFTQNQFPQQNRKHSRRQSLGGQKKPRRISKKRRNSEGFSNSRKRTRKNKYKSKRKHSLQKKTTKNK